MTHAAESLPSEPARIADQLRRAHEGDAWHGPALRQVLSGVTFARATARPLPGAHTIAELVAHIAAWTRIARRRLEGEVVVNVPDSEDYPPPAVDEASWEGACRSLFEEGKRLERAIAAVPEERLGEELPTMGYSVYVLLHGAVQHALYHAGQIALLKKAA